MSQSYTSLTHNRGLVRTDNGLTPTDLDCGSHLGEIKTSAAEENNFKAETVLETICAQQREFLLASAQSVQSSKSVPCINLTIAVVPSWRSFWPQGTFRNAANMFVGMTGWGGNATSIYSVKARNAGKQCTEWPCRTRNYPVKVPIVLILRNCVPQQRPG
jgi:hypothetical protein